VWQELDYRIDICRVTKGGHIEHLYRQMLQHVWQELDYSTDICRVTKGGHIEHMKGWTEIWSVSLSVDILLFGVIIPATVPKRSEIPEGFMSYPVKASPDIYIYI
jgi:hypothetical protein